MPTSKRSTPTQDTPGRTKPSSSRQQTEHGQVTQTGEPEIDQDGDKHGQKAARDVAKRAYDDRPSRDGKYGDGDQEPNPRPS
jgi:hypothetical protein